MTTYQVAAAAAVAAAAWRKVVEQVGLEAQQVGYSRAIEATAWAPIAPVAENVIAPSPWLERDPTFAKKAPIPTQV